MTRKLDPSCTLEIVRAAQDGDRQAFGFLVERHEQRLRALIHVRLGRLLRERVEVEDVLQDTYLRAFQSIHQFEWRGSGTFFQWLGGIAEHVIQGLARYHLKTQKRDVSREIPLEQPASSTARCARLVNLLAACGTPPSKALRRSERLERLEAALTMLEPDHREVIILARLRELPVREIAGRMGRSPDAVSMLLLRALRQLKKHFGNTESLGLPVAGLEQYFGGVSHRDGPPLQGPTSKRSGPGETTEGA